MIFAVGMKMIERVDCELVDGKIIYKDPRLNLGFKMTHSIQLDIIEKALRIYQTNQKMHGENRTVILIEEILILIHRYKEARK